MKFFDPLVIQWTGDNQWIVHNELRWESRARDNGTVAAGSTTDLASIPRLLWPLMPPAGLWARASVLHDDLYARRVYPRKKCDALFLEAMLDDGVPPDTARQMYAAVRAFGNKEWEDDD